jgi:hypothetical protein
MSDPVLDALAARAGSARPPPTSGDPVMDALTARASGKSFKSEAHAPSDTRALGDTDMDPDIGAGEAALHGASSLAGSAVGGIAGGMHMLGQVPNIIARAVTGAPGSATDEATDIVDWWKQKLTYEPRTSAGQGAVDAGAHALQTVGKPIQAVKDFAGDSAEAAGWGPLASTAMNVAPDALLSLVGAPGLPKGAGASLMEDAATAGRAVNDATGPARQAVSRAITRDDIPPSASPDANPFARESLGAAAAVPSQLATASPELQAAVRAEARSGSVDRAALDRHLEADSLPIPIRLTEGQATQDVAQLSHEMNRRAEGDADLARHFNQQNQQLIDNFDEIRREAAPYAVGNDHIQNGQALIDSYKAYDEAVSADIGAKYKALRDANGGDFPVDGPAFVQSADAALKKSMKARYVPAQIAADLEEFRSGPMTFENFENMRTNLAAEARKADRSGDGNAAAAIRIVRDSLEDLPITGESAKLKPLADAARQAAKARFDRMRADPAYRAAVDDSVAAGEASPLADDFVQKFVVKGKAANIHAMRETLADDPTAGETIAAGALNYVKSKSGVNIYTNEGNFSQAGYNRALAELTPKLDVLVGPKVGEQVQTLGNVARYTQAQPRGSFVNNSNTTVAEHAMNLAKGVAERGVNALVPGADLGSLAREKLSRRADNRFAQEAMKPGAGLKPRPHR